MLQKASDAKNTNINAEIEEQIRLAYAEWQIVQFTSDTGDVVEFMQGRLRTALNDYGLNVRAIGGGYKVTFSDLRAFEYNASTGTLTEGIADGKVKFGNLILGIGDQVNYDPTLNATGTITYTSKASTTKYSGDQLFDATTYKNAGFKWRVLDVKNGKIRLIADTDIGPGDYSKSVTKYYLKGSAGYINGVNELNAICSIFGHGKGADSATSITVDDINHITGYNPTIAKFNEGQWGEYGSKVIYTRGSGNALSASATNGNTWSGSGTFTTYFADDSKILSTLATNSSTPQIKSTYYNYNPTTLDSTDNAPTMGVDSEGNYNEIYKMIFGEYKAVQNTARQFTGSGRRPSYWLASDCARTNNGSTAGWGLHIVDSGDVKYDGLYFSGGYEYGIDYGVRPVVSLLSNVNIQWNATVNEWQIQ